MMRRVLAVLFLSLVALPGFADGPATKKPMVVLFYADWCYNCKLLLPKLAEAQKGLEDQFTFVKLDSTNEQRKTESRVKAKELGISKLWYANHATGWAALFDSKGQQVDALKQDMSVDELRARLEDLVNHRAPAAQPAAAVPAT